jgi:hypothetical protein
LPLSFELSSELSFEVSFELSFEPPLGFPQRGGHHAHLPPQPRQEGRGAERPAPEKPRGQNM